MKILYVSDGSHDAEAATAFLLRLDLTAGDEITILHVIAINPFLDDGAAYSAQIDRIRKDVAPRIIDSALSLLRQTKARLSPAILEGYPDKSIIAYAKESGADLVVAGAKGVSGIKAHLIGSVTRSLAINCPAPLLVVRPSTPHPERSFRILVPTDGSPQAAATARLLAKLPFGRDAEIRVLNVLSSLIADIPERFAPEISERYKAEVATARTAEYAHSEEVIQECRSILLPAFARIDGNTRIGNPLEEILDEAAKGDVDLIAVGYHGKKALFSMMGSVSRAILGHAPRSVLIGKE
ncbi:MAG: universal stress protein [Chloroflexota bacterium]